MTLNTVEISVAIVPEIVTTVMDNSWYYDSGATSHICNNRSSFKTFKPSEDITKTVGGNIMIKGCRSIPVTFINGHNEKTNIILENVM